MASRPKKSDKPISMGAPGEITKRAVKPLEQVNRKGEDPEKFHPFRVQLMIQDSELLPDDYLRPAIYYVRGHKKRPDLVLQMADQLWQKWEKFDMGLFTEYPDTRGHGFAEVVDEDDFQQAWAEVRKYNLHARVAGDVSDPMAFTCIGRTDI